MDNEMTVYSKLDLEISESILLKLDPNRFNQFDYKNINAYNETFDSAYSGGHISKSQYHNCDFNKVFFDGTNGDSSKFIACHFLNCKFETANFGHSDFSYSILDQNSSIYSCGFTKSNFINTLFNRVAVSGCNFIETWLVDTQIKNSTFEYCNFENSMFDSVTFENMDLSKVTIDYVEFRKCSLSNVVFQFFGIIHSFNGLNLIKENEDNVFLKFPDSPNQITGREFLLLLKDLEAYFYYKNDYFALANINIFFGENKTAYKNIVDGLNFCFNKKDFKEIKYLCKLASSNLFFTKKQLIQLYTLLTNKDVIEDMTYPEYRNYLDEIEDLKRLLIDNPYNLPQTKITIETDIDYSDTKNVVHVIESINTAYSLVSEQSSTYLSIRHNSPDIFEFFLSNNDVILDNTFIVLVIIMLGVNNQVVEFIKNLSDVAKNALEIYLLQLELNDTEKRLLFGEKVETFDFAQKRKTKLTPKAFRKHIRKIKFSTNTASKESGQKRTFEIEFIKEDKE